MEFEDEQGAKKILEVGYYHLGFYCFPFEKTFPEKKNRTHEYVSETYFEDVVGLYCFNNDLRDMLTSSLTRIELHFRAFLTDTVSTKYPELTDWFVCSEVVSEKYLKDFEKTLYHTSLVQNNPLIKAHHKKYPKDKFASVWKIRECMSFGNVFYLYKHLKDDKLRIDIAKNYGCRNEWVFRNYFKIIKFVRNTCAHGGCLYDISLPLNIKSNGPAVELQGENVHNIYGAIQVIKYIVGEVSKYAKLDLVNRIDDLLKVNRSPSVENIIAKYSGFQPKSRKKCKIRKILYLCRDSACTAEYSHTHIVLFSRPSRSFFLFHVIKMIF